MTLPWRDTPDAPPVDGWAAMLTAAFPNITPIPLVEPDGSVRLIRIRIFTPADDAINSYDDYRHLLHGYLAVLYLDHLGDPQADPIFFHHLAVTTVIRACAKELMDGDAWR